MRQMVENVLGSVEGTGYLHTASYESIYSHAFILSHIYKEVIHSHRGIPEIPVNL